MKIYTSNPVVEVSSCLEHKGLVNAYVSTFLLTLTNPATILFFMAAFKALGTGSVDGDGIKGIIMVIGVFIGSSLWWLLLSAGFGQLKDKLMACKLSLFNHAVGAIIFSIGIYAMRISLFDTTQYMA